MYNKGFNGWPSRTYIIGYLQYTACSVFHVHNEYIQCQGHNFDMCRKKYTFFCLFHSQFTHDIYRTFIMDYPMFTMPYTIVTKPYMLPYMMYMMCTTSLRCGLRQIILFKFETFLKTLSVFIDKH